MVLSIQKKAVINYFNKSKNMRNMNSNLKCFTEKQVLSGHDMDKGRIIKKYNIVNAKLEYYFIPMKNIDSYESAKIKQEQNAAKMFGMRLESVSE